MADSPQRIDLLYAWLGCDEKAGDRLWFGYGSLYKGEPGLRRDFIDFARREAKGKSYAQHFTEVEQLGCVDRAIIERMMPRTKDSEKQICWRPLDSKPTMEHYRAFVESDLPWRIGDEMKATYESEYEGGARDYYHGASRDLERRTSDYSGIEGVEDTHEEREVLDKPDRERHELSTDSPFPNENILRQERRDLATALVREFRSSLSGTLRKFIDLIIEFLTVHEIEEEENPDLEDIAPTVLSLLEVSYDRLDDLKEYVAGEYTSKSKDPEGLFDTHTFRLRREEWMPFKEETHRQLWQEYRESLKP